MSWATLALLFVSIDGLAGCARSSSREGSTNPAVPMNNGGASSGASTPTPTPTPLDGASTTLNVGAMNPDASPTSSLPSHPVPPAKGTLSSGTVPSNPGALFGAAQVDTSAAAPSLVYPTPETMFPPNMPNILFQWRAPTGSVFRLHFAEGSNTFDVYTDGRDTTCDAAGPGNSCWESSANDLMAYFGNAADIGADVTFSVSAMDSAQPSKMTVSPTYTVHVAKTDITGAVYYWSTTAQGLRRGNFGGAARGDGGVVSRPGPIDYITNSVFPATTEAPANRCAACHTLSRDGTKLAVSLNGDVLGIIDVVATIPPPLTFGPPSQGFTGAYIGSSWSAFSPDDKKIITASTGVMTVRDVATGQPIAGTGIISLPANTAGSMPDWSPDGQTMAFASTPVSPPNQSYGRHLYGSSIALFGAQGDGFAGYQLVATSSQTNCQATLPGGVTNAAYTAGARETYANPMFSNDSKWLVFSRGDCESEEDATAEVILAPAMPSAAQNHLIRANRQVGAVQQTNLTNSMPVWGPTNDPQVAWIAFTSTRDYGLVLTAGSKTGSNQVPPFPGVNVRQLWIAAVDMSKLTADNVAAIDPSYPAFRFSAQDLTENNHRPFWTVDTIPQVNEVPVPK
jgi:hypothetical protein